MIDRIRLLGAVLAATAVGTLLYVVAWPGAWFVGAVAVSAASYVVTIPTGAGRSVSLAPAVGSGLFLTFGDHPVEVLVAMAIGLAGGWLVARVRHGDRVTSYMFPAEPVGIGLALVLALAGVAAMHPEATIGPMMLAIAAVASVLSFLVSVVVRARTSSQRRVVSAHLIELRGLGDWPAHAALYASAALYAVTVEAMGLWSLPLAGLPYVFTHISLQRVQDTRVTYDQTIRALGAIPEAGHQVAAGHSRRTADLAVAIGAEVGLRATALRELEYAALLHDIGRVVLSNPAVSGTEYTFTDVSEWSAAIIGEVRLLEPVSAIVALQHAPYRQEGQVRDPMVPRASQIVRIAAKYDSSLSDGLAPTVALEALHRGAAYDYDPDIVMSLRRVLERRGSLAA